MEAGQKQHEEGSISKSLLRVAIIVHFIIVATYTVWILYKYTPFPGGVTLAMLISFGLMGGWLWMLNYLLLVDGG